MFTSALICTICLLFLDIPPHHYDVRLTIQEALINPQHSVSTCMKPDKIQNSACISAGQQDTSNSPKDRNCVFFHEPDLHYSLCFLQLLHTIVDQTLPGRASMMRDDVGCEDSDVGGVTMGRTLPRVMQG